MDVNTCFETTNAYHTIAYYSHLVPVAIAVILAIFVLISAKFNLYSKIFALFIAGFSLWLIGDVIIWTTQNYHLVVWLWAPLDYINVLFYLMAAYFFAVFIRGKDIENWEKLVLFAISIPAWWITATGQSIVDFYQPWCEATNNDWLTNYKLWVEEGVLAFIMLYGFFKFIKGDIQKRKQILVVSLALVLFLATFASTEYIASVTGIYELNLYSLFVLPVFLLLIIFSITNLRIFNFHTFGTQLLIYVLLIMLGSQFFFLQDATYRILTMVTFALSLSLGILLVRNIRKEEQLSIQLEVANEGQANLLHIINHQIKGYLSKSRNIFYELLHDSGYGVTDQSKPMLEEGFNSTTEGVQFVTDFLNASNIEKGTHKFKKEEFDFKNVVNQVAEGHKQMAGEHGLSYDIHLEDGDYKMQGDKQELSQSVRNLIENAIYYTKEGNVSVHLERKGDRILFYTKDTGMGISDELKPKLFTKGGRDSESLKINVNSTGFGLSYVKGVVEAHNGRVWAESEGKGKGSTFYMELPVS